MIAWLWVHRGSFVLPAYWPARRTRSGILIPALIRAAQEEPLDPTTLSVLLGVCGMLGWGVYDFAGGLLSKRMGSFSPLFWSQVSAALVIAALATSLGHRIAVTPTLVLLSAAAAALYCSGYLFFFAGFAKGTMSIVASTMNLWVVVTMLVAFVFMGQRLTPLQTLGAALIIGGATLASFDWSPLRSRNVNLASGVVETVFGATFFGVYWNVSELIADEVGWLVTTLLIKVWVVFALLGYAATRRTSLRITPWSPRVAVALAALGAIELGAVVAVNYGLAVGEAILVTPIASALSVVTIALAIVFLRERVSAAQAFGMTLAVVGIVTTAL